MTIAMWLMPRLVAKRVFKPTGHARDNGKAFIGAGAAAVAGRTRVD